jgi:hypothetical protein
MDRYIILDIDNCIADDGWRIKTIDWRDTDPFRRYHTYHQLSPWDAVGNRDLFEVVRKRIVVLTSRPVHYRAMTEEWLDRAEVPVKHLLMRNDVDFRPSLAVKASQLGWLWADYGIHLAQIDCAYDDREEILAMYRAHGLRTELRALHNICAYANPLTGINHATGQQIK